MSSANHPSGSAPQTRSLIRACRRTFLAGIVAAGALSAVINVLQLTVPLFMLQVHDRVLNSQSLDTLRMLMVIAFGAVALFGVLEFIRSTLFQAIAGRLLARLNLPVIEASLAASVQRGQTQGVDALRDIAELRAFFTSSAFAAPFEALWSPIFLAVMFAFHPLYGLLGIASIVILVALGLISDMMCRSTLKEAGVAQAEAVRMLGSSLRHAEVIEAMGMLPAVTDRWAERNHEAVMLLNAGNRRTRTMHAITRSVRYAMQITAIASGAYLSIAGLGTPGAMVGGSMIVARLLGPFDTVTGDWRQWVFAHSAWVRIRALLDVAPALREAHPTPRQSGALAVESVVYLPQGTTRPVLKGVSFALEPGDVLGIAGPSASGKSTLARMLVGAVEPTTGGVYLAGHNVFLWERASFGAQVGYLPQSVSLLDATVRENIARLGPAEPAAVIEAARAAGVHEIIGRLPLGYDTPIGDGRFTLSGGQKQRIALARALFGNPQLLVLDEPNSNLDAEGEQALVRAIEAARARGAIVVLVAHRQSVMRAATKLLIMQEGRVTQFGDNSSDVPAIESGRRSLPGGAKLVVRQGAQA